MSTKKRSDWTRTPAAMFAVGVLGISSIGGLAWSWNRSVERANAKEQILDRADAVGQPDTRQSVGGEEHREPARRAPDPGALSAIRRIDVNSANASELDLLPGIGPALASRIIADRQKHGAFGSIEDLARVKGIGPKTVEKLRGRVIVGETGAARASADEGG